MGCFYGQTLIGRGFPVMIRAGHIMGLVWIIYQHSQPVYFFFHGGAPPSYKLVYKP